MKYLLIYRGDNVREKDHERKREYTNLLINWENHLEVFIEDCKKNGHTCDVALVSYSSNIIQKIVEIIKPKIIILNDKSIQSDNFSNVVNLMIDNINTYDRFIISRCDISYKLPLSKWPKIEKKGIFVVNKNVHWPTYKYYSDVLFICDSPYVKLFNTAFNIIINNGYVGHIHALGKFLYENKYNFICMYDGYYHMLNNPLHQLTSMEGIADLNKPLPYIEITDVSEWN